MRSPAIVPIEKTLDRWTRKALDTLEGKGCERMRLVAFLHMMQQRWPPYDDWKSLSGLTLRQLDQADLQIRDCADLLESLNQSFYAVLLIEAGMWPLLTLAKQLRLYASHSAGSKETRAQVPICVTLCQVHANRVRH